jgi:hypothetical protein
LKPLNVHIDPLEIPAFLQDLKTTTWTLNPKFEGITRKLRENRAIGARSNLIPLSIWQALACKELTSTVAVVVWCLRWCYIFTVQLGTPRGRYDEYSSKVFPSVKKPRYVDQERKEPIRLKVMLASLRQLRTIYRAPRPSFALLAATRNLHTTQPNTLLPTYDEVVNLTGLLETKEWAYRVENSNSMRVK